MGSASSAYRYRIDVRLTSPKNPGPVISWSVREEARLPVTPVTEQHQSAADGPAVPAIRDGNPELLGIHTFPADPEREPLGAGPARQFIEGCCRAAPTPCQSLERSSDSSNRPPVTTALRPLLFGRFRGRLRAVLRQCRAQRSPSRKKAPENIAPCENDAPFSVTGPVEVRLCYWKSPSYDPVQWPLT